MTAHTKQPSAARHKKGTAQEGANNLPRSRHSVCQRFSFLADLVHVRRRHLEHVHDHDARLALHAQAVKLLPNLFDRDLGNACRVCMSVP
jgi:hypothetical protein